MTDEQIAHLVEVLKSQREQSRNYANLMLHRVNYEKSAYHDGRASAFQDVLDLLKLAGVDTGDEDGQ